MAKRITISTDDACIILSILRGEITDLRERLAVRPDEGCAKWLAEIEACQDRLTVKLFGREYLEREKAKVKR